MKQYNRDKRLKIEHYTTAQDDSGDPIESWVEYGTFWAHFEMLRGREMFQAQQVTPENQGRAIMLYSPESKAITQKMQAVLDGKTYNITSPPIDIDGSHEFIEIMLSEVV